jgi:trans-aconitate methyltransferase
MQTISAYNADQSQFRYEFRESRLRKCIDIVKQLPPGRMLDIGCTEGDRTLFWQDRGWES